MASDFLASISVPITDDPGQSVYSRDVTPTEPVIQNALVPDGLDICGPFLSTCILTSSTNRHTVQRYVCTLEYVLSSFNVADLIHSLFTPSTLHATMDRCQLNLTFLHSIIPTDYGFSDDGFLERIDNVVHGVINLQNAALLVLRFHPSKPIDLIPYPKAHNLDHDTLKPQQRLFEFLISQAGTRRLTRTEDSLFAPYILDDGTNTRCYNLLCDIPTFIYSTVAAHRIYPEHYNTLTASSSVIPHLIQLIGKMPDHRCPFLQRDRYLFSFRNGILDTRTGTFQSYDEYTGSSVSCRYFDFVVEEGHMQQDPSTLPTPHFDKILLDQQFTPHDRYWMYVLCGRMLYDVGFKDDWQVCLFIRGVAGSGKSTILKLLSMIYEPTDIGYLMSDGQTTFSDEHLYDKFMTLAMDVDKKMQFSMTRLNSIVSGEAVSVNRKFQKAITIKWTSPVIMASNSQPPFDDIGGNIVRRFVIFLFNHAVQRSDPRLFDKLKLELPMLVVKFVRTYLQAIERHGHQSLWDANVLPPIVHRAKQQYLVTTNPLSAFLESDIVVYGDEHEIPSSEFRKHLIQWSRENGDKKSPSVSMITHVDHGHLFAMYGCVIEERMLGMVRKVFIKGLSVRT